MRDPDVLPLLTLWRACEGKPGLAGLQEFGDAVMDGFAVIDEARAARRGESDVADG